MSSTLWFDVGIKRYTTTVTLKNWLFKLWFDVGIKRYTTQGRTFLVRLRLWFDVGIKRYTTVNISSPDTLGCGLM